MTKKRNKVDKSSINGDETCVKFRKLFMGVTGMDDYKVIYPFKQCDFGSSLQFGIQISILKT